MKNLAISTEEPNATALSLCLAALGFRTVMTFLVSTIFMITAGAVYASPFVTTAVGAVNVIVSDRIEAAVSNAKVTLMNDNKPPPDAGTHTQVRANDGSYVFPAWVGPYTVKSQKQGFKTPYSSVNVSLLASFLNLAGPDLVVIAVIVIFLLIVAVFWRLGRR